MPYISYENSQHEHGTHNGYALKIRKCAVHVDNSRKVQGYKNQTNKGACAGYYKEYPVFIMLLNKCDYKVCQRNHKVQAYILNFCGSALGVDEEIHEIEIAKEPNTKVNKQD